MNELVFGSGNGVSLAHAQFEEGSTIHSAGQEVLRFNLQNFSGDMDLANLSLGPSMVTNPR